MIVIINNQEYKIIKKMREKTRKQKIFDNLFNMAYEPVIVDKKGGLPIEGTTKKLYTTIFSALNNAEQHIMIKINPGIYNERVDIKKRDLKIQASQISQNTILINQEYPNITVNLPEKTDKVYFESLKIAHTCENSHKHEITNPSYQTLKKQDFMNFRVNSNINTCLYIKKGIVQMDECKISLAAYHERNNPLPCIVVQSEGCLILNRSQIRGSSGTIGIFSNGGKVVVKQSTFRDHGITGVLFCSINLQYPTLTIKNCTFIKCNESITLNGPFESIIESNTIRQGDEMGISILNGNRSKITNNQIKQCKIGIYIKNSYPSVLKNFVTTNLQWGCVIKSISGIMCKPLLKFNNFVENSAGGIFVQGALNYAQVFSNQIKFNNQFGIKVSNRASPHIFMNKIFKTLGNGVHICRGSSVFLEKNQIQASLKINLLIEGPDNIDNFIFRNVITKGRGQGILTIFGQKFIIKDNEIRQNYNGIVSLTGVQIIQDNRIVQNQRNGILLLCDNNVNINGNELQQNKKSGIFIRNTSVGRIEENSFQKNKTQIIIENDDNCFNNIEASNSFSKDYDYDIRIPKNYRCQLI